MVGFNIVNPLLEVVTDAATNSQAMEIAKRKYHGYLSSFGVPKRFRRKTPIASVKIEIHPAILSS